jgi:hypothetical protein
MCVAVIHCSVFTLYVHITFPHTLKLILKWIILLLKVKGKGKVIPVEGRGGP